MIFLYINNNRIESFFFSECFEHDGTLSSNRDFGTYPTLLYLLNSISEFYLINNSISG